ncbi:MAG: hypothetical protein JNK19_16035 [Tabrizicola sp.]|nr:hypothetical protein [Tabrizicola sp.]
MTILYIYSDGDTVAERPGRDRWPKSTFGEVVRWGCRSAAQFVSVLNHQLATQQRFQHVEIRTHGAPGLIGFGRDDIDIGFWLRSAARIQTGLCVPGGVVHFSGCNVGEGQEGWGFMEGAAAFWLKGAGGRVSAWRSVGFSDAFFGTGQVWHPTGGHRTLWVDANGRYLRRADG